MTPSRGRQTRQTRQRDWRAWRDVVYAGSGPGSECDSAHMVSGL